MKVRQYVPWLIAGAVAVAHGAWWTATALSSVSREDRPRASSTLPPQQAHVPEAALLAVSVHHTTRPRRGVTAPLKAEALASADTDARMAEARIAEERLTEARMADERWLREPPLDTRMAQRPQWLENAHMDQPAQSDDNPYVADTEDLNAELVSEIGSMLPDGSALIDTDCGTRLCRVETRHADLDAYHAFTQKLARKAMPEVDGPLNGTVSLTLNEERGGLTSVAFLERTTADRDDAVQTNDLDATGSDGAEVDNPKRTEAPADGEGRAPEDGAFGLAHDAEAIMKRIMVPGN